MRFKFLCILICLVTQYVSQPPSRFFTTIGSDGDDIAFDVITTYEGEYVIAGSSTSYGTHGQSDLYLVKVDSYGYPSWTKFIGGEGTDVGRSVIQVPDSGFVIAGYTNSFGVQGYDIYIVRTDKNGEILWDATWGGVEWEYAFDLVMASDTSLLIVGSTYSFGQGGSDGVLLKCDLDGQILWHRTYGGQEEDEFRAIIRTVDGAIAIAGLTGSYDDPEGDGWFLKMSNNGDTIFTLRFGGQGRDLANDLVQKSWGDYVIAGARTFLPQVYSNSYMLSFDSTGNFIYENYYYHSFDHEEYVALANSKHLPDHTAFLKTIPVPDFAMQGNIFVASPGGWPYKVNSFGGEQDERFYSIKATEDGGFVSVGCTNSFNSKGQDVFFIKQDSTIIWYDNTVSVSDLEDQEKGFSVSLQESSLYITSNKSFVYTVTMFDLLGKRLVLSGHNREHRIRCDDLPKGIYLLQFTEINGRQSCRKVFIRDE